MNPGVTIRPVASITREASPRSPRPTAAMRSPSTATSAATLGAPLPSITVPPLRRSDQAIRLLGDVDDLLGLDLVARPSRAIAFGITALHHEAWLHAMEGEPVVEALLGEGDEVLDRLGRIGGKELDLDDATLLHGDLGDLFHASGSFLRISGLRSLGPRAGRHDERDHESGQQRSDFHV